MMQIYINSVEAYIDEKAAVSLNLINFDIKDISNRSLNYTRDFVVPIAGNELAFGFSSNPYTDDDLPYTDFSVKIVSGAFTLLENGRGWITSVADGYYHITITDKSGAFQDMKDFTLGQKSNYTVGDVQTSINRTTGYKLDFIYNQYQVDFATANPDEYRHNWKTCNFSVYIKYLFDLFATSSGYTFTGSLWTDTEFLKLRTIVYSNGQIGLTSTGGNGIDHPVTNPSETFYTLFKEVLKIFCAVFKIEGKVITIERFDELVWTSPADWADKLISVKNKRFFIPDTSQLNYLRYNSEGEAAKTLNQVSMECTNLNLTHETDLIKMNASVFPFIAIAGYHTLISSNADAIFLPEKDSLMWVHSFTTTIKTAKSTDKFVFITDGEDSFSAGVLVTRDFYYGITPNYTDSTKTIILEAEVNRTIATYYNSVNDYVRVAAMLQDPVFYEAEMFLSPVDIQSFDPFNIVSIPELGGNFYVNAIKNYLLSSDKKTATVELIKVNE